MRYLYLGILILILPSCSGNPPPPDPTEFSEMILTNKNKNGKFDQFNMEDFGGAINCCPEKASFGWPLYNKEFVDYVEGLSPNKVSFYHMRLGPFLSYNEDGYPFGTYVEVDGKADLTRFDERMFEYVEDLIRYTCEQGSYVEVDIIDGWRCKRTDVPHPWKPEYNTFGDDWWDRCGNIELYGNNPYTEYVRKVVEHTGKFGCVIYQEGNEIGQVGDYNPVWSNSLANHVRLYEEQFGYKRHLFGTNSGRHDVFAADYVDYISLHQNDPAQNSIDGKPTLVNEYNPGTTFQPHQIYDKYCIAINRGTYFWYWRHSQTLPMMDQTLLQINNNPCGIIFSCPLDTPHHSNTSHPRFNISPYGRGLQVSPLAQFGQDYCRKAGWTDGRSSCEVAPPGHPDKYECEIAFMGQSCPTWRETECFVSCPMTFNTYVGDKFHPINSVCPDQPNHLTSPQAFWTRPEGKGYVEVCMGDVCTKYDRLIDQ